MKKETLASTVSFLPDIHRLLPQSPEAEMGVISSFMLAPVEVYQICTQLGIGSHFFHIPAHAEVYTSLVSMAMDNKPMDIITVTQAIRERGKLEAVGGPAAITSLAHFMPTAANVHYYLDELKRHHLAREVIRIGTEYAARAYEATEEPENLAHEAHSALTALLVTKSKRKTIKEHVMDIISEMQDGAPDGEIIPTGIPEIDAKLQLYRGDLLIISAPTSCGKSALTNQILLTAAIENKARIAFYPLESRTKQMIKRALAVRAGFNVKFARNIANNAKNQEQEAYAGKMFAALTKAAQEIVTAPLHIRDDLYTLESIIADLRAEHAKSPFSFAAIDYLQLIRCAGKFERRQLMIAEITQRLKVTANELNMVLIVPSQQNKEGGTREAADSEMDASALIKIHADTESEDVKPGRVEIWKQREGSRHGNLNLIFNDILTRFECPQPIETTTK
jgi:replicative DNA helicase